MNLDIASGRKPHKGYQTIDIEEYAKPDYLGDFRTMHFEDIENIRAHHILEHFSREEALDVLKLWNSWLMSGGQIIIETPDFEGICKDFVVDPYWMSRHAFGSQEADWAFHRSGWWEDRFKEYLSKAGFDIVRVSRSKSRKILPNITVTARKNGI